MFGALSNWLDHRTGIKRFMGLMLIEHIPGGARWRYVWGSCLAFVFAIQLITGVLLMTAYAPSDTSAWGSVYFIQYQMDFGWLIRGLHHFGSQTMVVLLAVHMLQVVIAGAQLPPREVNWWLGIALMGVVLGLSLTGYLLPWDQKGFYATQVATNIAKDIPYIGESLREFLIGGQEYGNATLTRFFTLHVWVLPFTLIALVVLHLVTFRRHGVTAPRFRPEDEFRSPMGPFLRDLVIGGVIFGVTFFFHIPLVTCLLLAGIFWMFALSRFVTAPKATGWFFPDQAFRDLLVCLFIFAVMVSLVLYGGHGNAITPAPGPESSTYEYWAKAGQRGLGANLDAPADPQTASYPARPEWYFLFLFQLLKYFQGEQKLIGTVAIPNGAFVLLLLLPLFGYGRMRKFGHFLGIVVVVAMLGGAAALTVLGIADDALEPFPFGKNEPFTLTTKPKSEREAFHHAIELAEIDAKRAVQLASQGIPVEGARTMLRNDPLTRGPMRFESNCAVCHSYSPADDRGVVFNDPKVKYTASDLGGFATEPWIRDLLKNPGDDRFFGRTSLDGMRKWRKNLDARREKAMKKNEADAVKEIAQEDADFDVIAKFLAQQSKPGNKRDEKLQKDGVTLFADHCGSCHRFAGEGGESGPDLTGYGSQEWLRLMIAAPNHPLRFGDKNQMPAFRDFSGPGGEIRQLEFDELYRKTGEDTDKKAPRVTVNKLSDVDREIIIRWLTRDNRAVFGGSAISGGILKTE